MLTSMTVLPLVLCLWLCCICPITTQVELPTIHSKSYCDQDDVDFECPPDTKIHIQLSWYIYVHQVWEGGVDCHTHLNASRICAHKMHFKYNDTYMDILYKCEGKQRCDGLTANTRSNDTTYCQGYTSPADILQIDYSCWKVHPGTIAPPETAKPPDTFLVDPRYTRTPPVRSSTSRTLHPISTSPWPPRSSSTTSTSSALPSGSTSTTTSGSTSTSTSGSTTTSTSGSTTTYSHKFTTSTVKPTQSTRYIPTLSSAQRTSRTSSSSSSTTTSSLKPWQSSLTTSSSSVAASSESLLDNSKSSWQSTKVFQSSTGSISSSRLPAVAPSRSTPSSYKTTRTSTKFLSTLAPTRSTRATLSTSTISSTASTTSSTLSTLSTVSNTKLPTSGAVLASSSSPSLVLTAAVPVACLLFLIIVVVIIVCVARRSKTGHKRRKLMDSESENTSVHYDGRDTISGIGIKNPNFNQEAQHSASIYVVPPNNNDPAIYQNSAGTNSGTDPRTYVHDNNVQIRSSNNASVLYTPHITSQHGVQTGYGQPTLYVSSSDTIQPYAHGAGVKEPVSEQLYINHQH